MYGRVILLLGRRVNMPITCQRCGHTVAHHVVVGLNSLTNDQITRYRSSACLFACLSQTGSCLKTVKNTKFHLVEMLLVARVSDRAICSRKVTKSMRSSDIKWL